MFKKNHYLYKLTGGFRIRFIGFTRHSGNRLDSCASSAPTAFRSSRTQSMRRWMVERQSRSSQKIDEWCLVWYSIRTWGTPSARTATACSTLSPEFWRVVQTLVPSEILKIQWQLKIIYNGNATWPQVTVSYVNQDFH